MVNNSPLQTTWEAAFTAINESPEPYSAIRIVPKGTVEGVPPWFMKAENWVLVPTYRGQTVGGSLVIRDVAVAYVVTKTKGGDVTPLNDHAAGFIDAAGTNTANRPLVESADKSKLVMDDDDDASEPWTLENIIAGFIALYLVIALYLGYKGLKSVASVFGPETGTATESASTPTVPRLAHAARGLDDKQYNIFVSHSWTYDDHYERVVDFLEEVPSLDWQNHSVPSTDPLDVTTNEALEAALRDQMRTASVVVVSAGMYGAHSKWIPRELEFAEEMGKPVIAIMPEGQDRVPKQVQETAAEIVGWRKASLVEALAEHG